MDTIEELRQRVEQAESAGDLLDLALAVLDRAEALEEALRSLASYVGAGGYNAPTVDAKTFEDKVRWGIDHLLGVNHVGKLEAKIRELDMRLLASRSARSQAERDRDQLREQVKTGYMVTCDLSRSLLALQEKVHTMASDCRESAEHLEEEVSRGNLFGDFKHPKAERAEVLAGCAKSLERILTPNPGVKEDHD